MDTQRPVDTDVVSHETALLPWSAPTLERLDLEGTAKGASSQEDTLAYTTLPIC